MAAAQAAAAAEQMEMKQSASTNTDFSAIEDDDEMDENNQGEGSCDFRGRLEAAMASEVSCDNDDMETEDRLGGGRTLLRLRVDEERAEGGGRASSSAAGSDLRIRDGGMKVRRMRDYYGPQKRATHRTETLF